MAKPPRHIRWTEPSRQPGYRRLYKQINDLKNHLEDTISHFHKTINELRSRVSTLEKKQGAASRLNDDT
jgi:predicted  nucleic acid-binding Zn-ribbon protein